MDKCFAAFIMTYERPLILKETIYRLLEQTLPPEKILVIDNSSTLDSEKITNSFGRTDIVYHHVGFNSGPAGAAKIGLEILVAEGYEWIYWGDDDDPPVFVDTFEVLLRMAKKNNSRKIGIMGAVGQYFKNLRGEIERVPDSVLRSTDPLLVDSIAGNQCMIVNADVIKKGVLPNEQLFFGFEELDFCFRTKKTGFDLLVSGELFLRAREKFGRMNYKRPLYTVRERKRLIRQYYSQRNLLYILKDNGLYLAVIYQTMKGFFKLFYGFRFGVDYGMYNIKMITNGIYHAGIRRLGKIY